MSQAIVRRRTAFTLFQLLVLLALLSLLFALLLPAVQKVREAAARTQCMNNMRQVCLAMHNCNDSFQEIPLVAGPWKGIAPPGPATVSHFFALLPYIEQDNLYKNALAGTDTAFDKSIMTYQCPADATGGPLHLYDGWLGVSNYAANAIAFQHAPAPQGAPQTYSAIPRSFPDGTSNTVVYAERLQMCGGQPTAWAYAGLSPWTAMFGYYSTGKFQVTPTPAQCDSTVPQSPHAGGLLVGLGDGSVRLVQRNLTPTTWWRVIHPADGNVLGNDW